jgi:hypothetical protein
MGRRQRAGGSRAQWQSGASLAALPRHGGIDEHADIDGDGDEHGSRLRAVGVAAMVNV